MERFDNSGGRGSGPAVPLEPTQDITFLDQVAGLLVQLLLLAGCWWPATVAALGVALVVTDRTLDPFLGLAAGAPVWFTTVAVMVVVPGWSWRPLASIGDRWPRWLRRVGVGHDPGRRVRRTLLLGFRVRWPGLAAQAALTAPVHGHQRAPKVLAYDRDLRRIRPRWRHVTLKPLVTTPRERWPHLGDQLLRSWGWSEATTRVDDRHRVTITLVRDPLPRHVELPNPTRVSPVEGFVPLGVGPDGVEFGWRPDDEPHLAVTGITKGGKGITVRHIERHAAAWGWIIYRANPKLTGESDWLRGVANLASTPTGMWAMSTDVVALMRHRQQQIQAAGVDSWDDLPGIGPRVVFIIDETANLISPAIRDERRPYAQATSSNVTALAAMARSAGIHLVVVTQQPGVDSFGYSGGQTRLNIGARMIIGHSEAIWIRELFLGDPDPTITHALTAGIKGRCVYQGLTDGDGGRICKGQIYYCDQATARRALPSEPPVALVDYDSIGPDRWATYLGDIGDTERRPRSTRSPRGRGRS